MINRLITYVRDVALACLAVWAFFVVLQVIVSHDL